MEKNILVVNIGSSSKKYSFYSKGELVLGAHFEKDKEIFEVTYGKEDPTPISKNVFNDSISAFYNALYARKIIQEGGVTVSAIGMRMVAPGLYFTENRIVDSFFMNMLKEVSKEDSLHIEPIQKELSRIKEIFGEVKVFAISDSAFHRTMPNVSKNYALPKKIIEEFGLYRFGYHGISLASIVSSLVKRSVPLERKIVICHLGSGASVTAVLDGKSIETSMGYSPLEGLVMSSRTGSIDVGAVLRLFEKGNTEELRETFYNKSGLLALSGLSNDMRVLIDKEKEGHVGAKNAIDAFAYGVRKHIAMAVSALNGIDLLVFSGTIGERSFILRERICRDLGWLNVNVDNEKNILAKSGEYISVYGSLGVCVMHSDEDIEIMNNVEDLL